jgi:hypothetical protein
MRGEQYATRGEQCVNAVQQYAMRGEQYAMRGEQYANAVQQYATRGLIRAQRFGTEPLGRAIFPSACARAGASCSPHPLCPPLPRSGRGGYGVRKRSFRLSLKTGAPPCAPTPLSHPVGEGLGVRANWELYAGAGESVSHASCAHTATTCSRERAASGAWGAAGGASASKMRSSVSVR